MFTSRRYSVIGRLMLALFIGWTLIFTVSLLQPRGMTTSDHLQAAHESSVSALSNV